MKILFGITLAAGMAIALPASAQKVGLEFVPGHRALQVNGYNCIVSSLYARTAWCNGIGRVELPACIWPIVIDGKLFCADGKSAQR